MYFQRGAIMSVRVMSLVWERYPKGGAKLLTMLAMADWSNDEGCNLYPSMSTIAKKLRVHKSVAQRHISALTKDGFLIVTDNHHGGSPNLSCHYQIDLEKLKESKIATGRKNAQNPSQKCVDTGRKNATQTVIDTPIPVSGDSAAPKKQNAKSRGTRLDPDFEMPDDWGNWALEERPAWSNGDVVQEFAKFVDHWIAQPGQKGVSADWFATWRNWCRRSYREGSAS